ncbi:MAG: NAD(P)/FAD-dependent oxidoreductase [Chitinophagaceae bacterium]
MSTTDTYDVAIIGGGLAGLALSIQLVRRNYRVVLFEKEKFPFHKVCGEYISMESWNFLQSLGLPLAEMELPLINKLQVTAPDGTSFTSPLPLGGFGISRYLLDSSLAAIARSSGVILLEQTKVEGVSFSEDFLVSYQSFGNGVRSDVIAHACCAAYGKRSNLDTAWNRSFVQQGIKKPVNYVGIKYHITGPWPGDLIALHNFENGYCGISRIEDNKFCLCYMTQAENLKAFNGNIVEMEQKILYHNPHLKKILTECTRLATFPVTIAQINFVRKNAVERGVLMIGDAAGTIPPLCGNGMSMALHGSKIAASCLDAFLSGGLGRTAMEEQYAHSWNHHFGKRLWMGRTLQQFFGRMFLTNIFVATFKLFPPIARRIIRQTHGKPF